MDNNKNRFFQCKYKEKSVREKKKWSKYDDIVFAFNKLIETNDF